MFTFKKIEWSSYIKFNVVNLNLIKYYAFNYNNASK